LELNVALARPPLLSFVVRERELNLEELLVVLPWRDASVGVLLESNPCHPAIQQSKRDH
jgi:hypothetical protein